MDSNRSSLLHCSPVQKRAILKIAIELVKADNRIHTKEISILDRLQDQLSLSQEELDIVHYTSLADAVAVVRSMEQSDVDSVLGLISSIMKSDNDVDFDENMLFAAVTMSCHPASRDWSCILSVPGMDVDIPGRQIVFLEKSFSEEAHRVLDDKYDNLLISKAFGDIGLDLFYLPNIIHELGFHGQDASDKFGLLKKSMSYLMPAGDKLKVEKLRESLSNFHSEDFFRVVASRLGLEPGFFPYNAFLLIKLRESIVFDDDDSRHNTADFFCLDISHEVKHRILSFVSLFGDSSYLLPYDGYYRILFEHFSSESKINSEISLNGELDFSLPGLDGRHIVFESSPQARTLYLLLLKYGRSGISQDVFNAAVQYLETVDVKPFILNGVLDMDAFERELLSEKDECRKVIDCVIKIYRVISTKDVMSPSFLSYISSILSHRSSLKTYINKGFASVKELSNPGMYFIEFDRTSNAYRLNIGLSMFLMEVTPGQSVPLQESVFWKSLP